MLRYGILTNLSNFQSTRICSLTHVRRVNCSGHMLCPTLGIRLVAFSVLTLGIMRLGLYMESFLVLCALQSPHFVPRAWPGPMQELTKTTPRVSNTFTRLVTGLPLAESSACLVLTMSTCLDQPCRLTQLLGRRLHSPV